MAAQHPAGIAGAAHLAQYNYAGRLDHPRRCQAKRRRGPCGAWALRGARYCVKHGGKIDQRRTRNTYLPNLYRRHISQTLAQSVEHFLEHDPIEQVSLWEELALMRVHAEQLVKIYDVAIASKNTSAITKAGYALQEALNEVRDMCIALVSIRKSVAESFTVMELQAVIGQLTRLLYQACGDDHEDIACRFEELVRTKLQVKFETKPGTDVTPDVIEMDETIPNA